MLPLQVVKSRRSATYIYTFKPRTTRLKDSTSVMVSGKSGYRKIITRKLCLTPLGFSRRISQARHPKWACSVRGNSYIIILPALLHQLLRTFVTSAINRGEHEFTLTWCRFSASFLVKVFPQPPLQIKGLSPVWVSRCLFRSCCRLNDKAHWSHENGLDGEAGYCAGTGGCSKDIRPRYIGDVL